MARLVIHPLTEQHLRAFAAAPGHALLVVGPAGIGKQSLAERLTAELMEIDEATVASQPYVKIIGAGKDRSISIEKVRELEQFLSRKVPGNGKRVILIEDAHLLGTEAQNALLKTLEEPPADTTLLLTVAHEQALLPTIRSRAPALTVLRPEIKELQKHFRGLGFDETAIARAHAMSGGMPGLMSAILENKDDHPLVQAAGIARQIAGGSTFDRLAMVDKLSKDREQCLQALAVLQQMARVSLRSARNEAVWQRILTACHEAIGELLANGQPKLVLTNLMLSL